MTLVIGMNCGNGVVVGSDSMATTTDPINRSVNIQQYSTKVHIYDKKVIVGVAGSVGMCQVQLDSLKGQWHPKVLKREKNVAKSFIADTTFKATQPYIERSRAFHNGRIDDSLITALMVAAPLRSGPVLLEFDHQKAVEEKNEEIYFQALGSGAPMAYPFLKFIDKIFWQGKPPPTISDGVFGVLWTLHHVIDANAMMGIGGPPQVAVLEKGENDKWNARTLLDEELQEHQQSIDAAEQSLRDYKKNLKPPDVMNS